MQNQTLQNNLSVMGNSVLGENNHRHLRCDTLIDYKKILNYCNEEYCLSCAYFQQTKGNFGRCTVLKQDKKFDGSKKGSACKVWRLNSQLIQITQCNPVARPEKPNGWIDKLRLTYNQEAKQQRLIRNEDKRSKWPERKEVFNASIHQGEFVRGLPFDTTTDVRIKKAFYQHKTPKKVIEIGIELLDDSISLRDASKGLEEVLGYKISHRSLCAWAKKFRPEIKRSRVKPAKHEMKRKIAIKAELVAYNHKKEKHIAQINSTI